MILNGALLTHIKQSGKIIIKIIIPLLGLVLLLCSCSAEWWLGDGRGDFALELLNGYSISKINSKQILLTYKDNPEDTGSDIIIPNFYIVSYQINEPYICFKGIRTQDNVVSEKELDEMIISYYIVNTTGNEVVGPFETNEEFLNNCYSMAIDVTDEWEDVKNETQTNY